MDWRFDSIHLFHFLVIYAVKHQTWTLHIGQNDWFYYGLPESVTVRMETYERSTAPLIEFYRNLGLLLPVAATGSPDEIYARTSAALQQGEIG